MIQDDKQTELEVRKLLELCNAYRVTFSSETGKIVLEHLKTIGFFYRSSHHPGAPDETAFREGSRHIVLEILAGMSEHKPEEIRARLREQDGRGDPFDVLSVSPRFQHADPFEPLEGSNQ